MTDTQDDPRTSVAPVRRVEIFTGVGRRRIWSAEDKARIVAESLAPDASVSGVARTHGLTSSQIFRWRRILGVPKPPPALGFAPVIVEDKPLLAAGHVIEVELKGAKLRVPMDTPARTIVALVKALRR